MMSTTNFSIFVVATFAFLGCAGAEVTVISEPDPRLQDAVLQRYYQIVGVEDLRTATFADNEKEVRFWQHGPNGELVSILQYRDGEWSNYYIDFRYNSAAEPESLAAAEGIVGSCAVEPMRDRCVVREVQVSGWNGDGSGLVRAGTLYHLTCPIVGTDRWKGSSARSQEWIAGLWDRLMELGLWSLPPTVERDGILTHQTYYDIEVRIGNEYRYSTIRHIWEDERLLEVDHRVEAIKRALGSMHPGMFPRINDCWIR